MPRTFYAIVIAQPATVVHRFSTVAERTQFLAQLPPKEARDIAGSWEKLARAKGGETLEEIYNQGKDPL